MGRCWTSTVSVRFQWAVPDLALSVDARHSEHCDLALAVETRQCSLWPGVRSWDPSVPTDIHNLQLRSSTTRGEEGGDWKGERWNEKATLIKSTDPHLVGGEIPYNIGIEHAFYTWMPMKAISFSVDFTQLANSFGYTFPKFNMEPNHSQVFHED